MAIGNTFGATALASYGGFWVSYSIILTPSFGVADAYATVAEYNHAMGCFLMVRIPLPTLILSVSHHCAGVLHIHSTTYIVYPEGYCGLLSVILPSRRGFPFPGPGKPPDK